ncbi:MAG TPA: response regulator transcription factor [Steroidobacteraceae bacterium]|nr:response regulator transcription factor [Steroidobacteraceae bacterium]
MIGPTRVLLVDDHAIVREGYRRLLEDEANIDVVGEACDAAQAYELVRSVQPDVVVMDIALPGVSGIEATRRMLREQSQLRVLMFSMYDDAIYARRALEAGALGYLSKATAPEVLVRAIHAVSRGERYVSPDVASRIAGAAAQPGKAQIAALSPREFEVLRLLVRGETVRSISEKLALSEKTVANHQSTIRDKLGARNSAQLARLASQLDLNL